MLLSCEAGVRVVASASSTLVSMPCAALRNGLSLADADNRAWLEALRAHGHRREEAIARLHALLLRAARYEVARRAAGLAHLRGNDLDDLALQSADDALVAVLGKLDEFRGQSRFTTWAHKFAILEAAVNLRRRAWQGKEIPLEPEAWRQLGDGRPPPQAAAEQHQLLKEVRAVVDGELTPHQREVLVAVALNEVPIDVLAQRLNTTRGALYKTIHDARRKLQSRLESAGHDVDASLQGAPR